MPESCAPEGSKRGNQIADGTPRIGWVGLGARYVAPILLVLVALFQQSLSHGGSLTPWKGGGFGMFSSYDSPGARLIRVYLENDGERTPVSVPRKYRRAAADLRALPTTARLEDLAAALASETWIDLGETVYKLEADDSSDGESPDLSKYIRPAGAHREPGGIEQRRIRHISIRGEQLLDSLTPTRVPHEAVRVQLWKLRFRSEGAELAVVMVDEVVAPNPSSGRFENDDPLGTNQR